MENMKRERDYKKEQEREKQLIKRYTVKVPKYLANAHDEKLKKENRTYSSVAIEAIEKYLKKL